MDNAKRPKSPKPKSQAKPVAATPKPRVAATAPRRAPRPAPVAPAPTADAIARRAYEIHLGRGGQGGDALSDWLQAERELAAPPKPARRRAATPSK
jgi:hypothetical protein